MPKVTINNRPPKAAYFGPRRSDGQILMTQTIMRPNFGPRLSGGRMPRLSGGRIPTQDLRNTVQKQVTAPTQVSSIQPSTYYNQPTGISSLPYQLVKPSMTTSTVVPQSGQNSFIAPHTARAQSQFNQDYVFQQHYLN